MQITPDQLLAEAGQMALELRFKDRTITQLLEENKQLQSSLAALQEEQQAPPEPDGQAAGQTGYPPAEHGD